MSLYVEHYQQSTHLTIGHGQNVQVDIVKGQFMSMRHEIFKSIALSDEFMFEDDICINSYSKLKYLPSLISNSFERSPNGEEFLWRSPGHFQRKNEAIKKYKKLKFLFQLKK